MTFMTVEPGERVTVSKSEGFKGVGIKVTPVGCDLYTGVAMYLRTEHIPVLRDAIRILEQMKDLEESRKGEKVDVEA